MQYQHFSDEKRTHRVIINTDEWVFFDRSKALYVFIDFENKSVETENNETGLDICNISFHDLNEKTENIIFTIKYAGDFLSKIFLSSTYFIIRT